MKAGGVLFICSVICFCTGHFIWGIIFLLLGLLS